jgi:hypothetical protein
MLRVPNVEGRAVYSAPVPECARKQLATWRKNVGLPFTAATAAIMDYNQLALVTLTRTLRRSRRWPPRFCTRSKLLCHGFAMDSLIEPEEQLSERYLRSPWGSYGRSATLGAVSLLSKFLLRVLNVTYIENEDAFHQHAMHRKEGVGLITVCTHTRYESHTLYAAICTARVVRSRLLHHYILILI